MSLRVRLLVSIVVVLCLSLGAGGGVASWHAVRSVRTEMQAALAVGTQTLRNGVRDLPIGGDPDAELVRLVHIFDGDRHVRAVLRDSAGGVRASSVLRTRKAGVPAWFVEVLSPPLAPARFDVGGGGAIFLEPDPHNEVSEVWTQLKDDFVAVGLFCALSVGLVSLVVGHALRPLERFSAALTALGSGEYAVRLASAGPPELVRLAQGVNALAERLQAAQARNLRLNEQILTLQEEERADLARDLHDEIGPFLFAVNLDVASIEQAALAGRPDDISERAHAIREAVSHMQRHVRAMLHRLRPASPVEVGLATALGNLVAFWRARRAAIDFVLDIAGDVDALDTQTMATVYRLVQESLNNAVRHGDPSRIDIVVQIADAGEVILQVIDDGVGLVASQEPGLGFTGMRERVEALGGTLRIGADERGKGLAVAAKLPCTTAMGEA